jgi:hypothetical protein
LVDYNADLVAGLNENLNDVYFLFQAALEEDNKDSGVLTLTAITSSVF